jgi:zinc/manganese transport system permease protein
MLDRIADLFQYHFMQNALLAGTIVAVAAGVVGWFMVLRGQSFAGHALSQVGFPGAAGAALVGATPALGLIVFCVGAALGVAALSGGQTVSRRAESAAIGSVLVLALALGYLFASLYHGSISAVYAFLFGTFLGITDAQVLALLVACIGVVAIVGSIARPLFFASVDPAAAAARGVPVRALSVLFLVVLAVGVAEAAQITGTLLVFALLVAPAASAHQLSVRPALSLLLSVGIAVAVAWVALALAYYSDYPIGFHVSTVAFAVYLGARAVRRVRG